MMPKLRALHRFFSAVADHCPVGALTHLHLTHLDLATDGSLLSTLDDAGFKGTLVAGRVSQIEVARQMMPEWSIVLDDHPSLGEPIGEILLELTPGREAARWTILAALEALQGNGRVWVFGSKESGIQALAKRFEPCRTELYKGHLRLISLPKESCPTEPADAKGNDDRHTTLDREGFYRFTHRSCPIISRPGLFSWQEPDPASVLLLSAMAEKNEDPGPLVLDWGCGSGLLTAVLAQRWPNSRFILSDDQYSAVRSARRTMAENQLNDRSLVIAENGLGPTLSSQRFSTILSNPPFHRGVNTDYDPFRAFIEKAAGSLTPKGTLWLVGNRFLDHPTQLARWFKQVEIAAQTSHYTVTRSRKGK